MSFPKVIIKYEIPPASLSPPTSTSGDGGGGTGGGGGGGGGEPPVQVIPIVSTASEGLAPIIPAGSGRAPHSFLRDDAAWQRIAYADLYAVPLQFSPLSHAATHLIGPDLLPPATLSSPGLVPPLPTDATMVLGGAGNWISVPTTGGGNLPPSLNDPSQYLRSDGRYAPLIQLAIGQAGVAPSAPGDATQVLLGNAHWGPVPGGGGGGGTVAWLDITGKPSTFPPSSHATSHITGADIIPLSTVSARGLVPALPNTAATYKYLRGDGSFSVIPLATASDPGFIPVLPNTAVTSQWLRGDNSFNAIPLANTSAAGLLATVSGNVTDYVGGDNAYHPLSSLLPPGTVVDYAGAAPAPSGWLICDGNSYPTATYPNLFNAIGYIYGGSGANFNVPDLRGRTVVGAGQGGGLTNRALAASGGEELHPLITGELAAHNHTASQGTHTHTDSGHVHVCVGVNHLHSVTGVDHLHGMDHYHNWGAQGSHSHGLSDGGHNHNYDRFDLPGGGVYAGGTVFTYRYTATVTGANNQAASSLSVVAAGTPAGNTVYASQTNGAWANTGAADRSLATTSGAADRSLTFNSNSASAALSTNSAGAITIDNNGSGVGHNTMQPFAVLNKIIKT